MVQIEQEQVDSFMEPTKIIVKLSEQLEKVNKLHKQVSVELPELLLQTYSQAAERPTTAAKNQNRDLKKDGVLTLYLDEADNDEQSTDEEVKEEEVYVPQCDSDRIAQLLERSQQAIQRCQLTIQNVEQTQEHINTVTQGCQQTLERSQELQQAADNISSKVFSNLISATKELEKTTKAQKAAALAKKNQKKWM